MFICFLYRLFFVFFFLFVLYMYFFLHCYCFFTIRFEWKPPEPQFATYVKICAKYARAKKRTKNFRKSTWHLWSFVSHWSARQCRRQSQQIPKTGRLRRSSFLVRCSSFVVYRRLVSVVSCSLVALVVCLAHNTIAAMSPPLSLSHLSFVGCVYAAPPSPLWRLPLLHSRLPRWRFQCQASSC